MRPRYDSPRTTVISARPSRTPRRGRWQERAHVDDAVAQPAAPGVPSHACRRENPVLQQD
eukprot:scaffold1085_cov407-Prasinococcus_capsulatus_cf.AAC.57